MGVVQGVGFRYYTKMKADALGLSGTVQNIIDGSVSIWVEGDEATLMKFLDWCHEGPSSASVESLEYLQQKSKGCKNFDIVRRNS